MSIHNPIQRENIHSNPIDPTTTIADIMYLWHASVLVVHQDIDKLDQAHSLFYFTDFSRVIH
jgi:hypothetical protein